MTREEIKERFEHFNELIFSGKLPTPTFRMTAARHTMGSLRYKTRHKLFGLERYNFTICMSQAFQLADSELDDILIHEMIHLEIMSSDLKDTSAHGRLFRARMSQINNDFGRHITISRRMTGTELKPDGRIRTHHVCVCTLPDSRTGICVTSPKHVTAFKRALPRLYDISNVTWHVTTDPYLNRFPHSVKPRLYILKDRELLAHLTSHS